ncbi:KTSC domain-containing protein [Methylophilus rhizosphaerae]|uniref:KTSC domain-containing protein n=1 Tax=Methylophilus rhizosphaerae TaxID=492660 RepID=A0A1G9DX61_9PROT|nr:KTSC domain-containing protein [Methylophilus rhizosphaerae]SDK68477.1 KTSC domain-containing protein [Methylophilus rhizosphaerae]
MDMLKTSSGKLRAIGYDARSRTLRVELDDGTVLEYANISESIWRNLKSSGVQWSYYRDNIEEEFTARRVSAQSSSGSLPDKNPLDDLFG